MANIFSENQKLFYSSRVIYFGNSLLDNVWNTANYFDLKPESAWNYGVSLTNSFKLFDNNAQLVLDYYYTDFKNQVVVDWETPSVIYFYNLEGKSFAKSFQLNSAMNLQATLICFQLIKFLKLRLIIFLED